jgi:hypothetical protein
MNVGSKLRSGRNTRARMRSHTFVGKAVQILVTPVTFSLRLVSPSVRSAASHCHLTRTKITMMMKTTAASKSAGARKFFSFLVECGSRTRLTPSSSNFPLALGNACLGAQRSYKASQTISSPLKLHENQPVAPLSKTCHSPLSKSLRCSSQTPQPAASLSHRLLVKTDHSRHEN